jgi:glycerol uptake facilitator-like aquaporin
MFYDFGEKIDFNRFSKPLRFFYILLFELISTTLVIFLQAGSQAGIYLASVFGATTIADVLSIAFSQGLAFYAVNAIFNRFGSGYTNPFFVIAFKWFKKDEKENDVQIRFIKVVLLILAEFACAVLGGLLVWGIIGDGKLVSGTELNLGRPNINPDRTIAQALGFEIVGTAILVFTVVFANAEFKFNPDNVLIGGLTVVALNLVGIPVSGASMNWLRHFGPTVVSNSWKESDWIYYVGPLIGASVVFVFYRIVIYSMRTKSRER